MPRYEFQEGSSNKFWEITLEGTSFVTRYGKIGTAGQETRKDWPSADKAKVEYEKLIAEKVKKGYQLVGGAPAPKAAKPEPAPKAAKPEPAPKAAKPEPAPKAAKPAKPEPAKPEPARAPAAPASAKGGALRYELVEGSSSKFWEIELQGDQFVTRYGKIGTNGQSTTKSFGDVATAKIEHDKLVAEKERKGYALVAGEKAGPPPEARNAELEAAILDRPDDDEAWAVYADWLLAQGDPRGELIALSLAGKKQEADKVFAANGSALVPGPARKRRRSEDDDDEGGSAWPLVQKGMTWERGFLRSLRVKPSHDDWESGCDAEHVGSALAEVFAHSSSRFLRELTLGLLDFESDPSYPVVLEAIVKERPPLRSLFLGDFEYPDDTEMSWGHIGDLSKLWQALPRLQRLVLQGGGELTLGAIDAPDLRHFELRTGGLPKSELASITSARWPALETLSLWLGSSSYGWDGSLADLEPILAAEGLPALRHLGLKNAELTDELAKRLPDAKLTKQLRTLDLSMGTLSDEGAKALAAGAAKLAHLERIDVADNIVATKALLAPLGAKVHFGKQRKIEDWWEDRRYVSVGE